ncbi:TetR/AcrR family transcriptional regulator [Pseudarthrobacter oxydans]|uniref:TetR/AcrR family transcriptional regulator n=1 Tax=Pseudarthrobacter oxydans TaxID=1671 RepID=UPI003819BDB5
MSTDVQAAFGAGRDGYPDVPVPRSAKGGRRRLSIMAAAAKLFRERGFANTTTDAIGEACGVSGPAIYHHFKNGKQQILAELIWEIGDELRQAVGKVSNASLSPYEQLELFLRAEAGAIHANPDIFPLIFTEDRYLRPEDLPVTLERRRYFIALRASLIRAVRPDLDHQELSTMSVTVQFVLGGTTFNMQDPDTGRVQEQTVQMALALVRSTPAGAPSPQASAR